MWPFASGKIVITYNTSRRKKINIFLIFELSLVVLFILFVWAGSKNCQGAEVTQLDILLQVDGHIDVNINEMKFIPKLNRIVGSTEENGFIFFINPENDQYQVFDLGRKVKDLKIEQKFAGDITDFIYYSVGNTQYLYVLQAYPAELYRYELKLLESGLVQVANEKLIYTNDSYARFMAADSNNNILVIGTYKNASILICDLYTFEIKEIKLSLIFSQIFGIKNRDIFQDRIYSSGIDASSFADVYFDQSTQTWFFSTYHTFVPDKKIPWRSGTVNFINCVIYTKDFITFHLSEIKRNEKPFKETSEQLNLSSPSLFLEQKWLYGEVAQTFVRLGKKLYFVTGMDNEPRPPFGGTIYVSEDDGEAFNILKKLPVNFSDAHLYSGGNWLGVLLMTKQMYQEGVEAKGAIIIADENGDGELLDIFKTSVKPVLRGGKIQVAGVSTMADYNNWIYLGTVDESSSAKIFKVKLIKQK